MLKELKDALDKAGITWTKIISSPLSRAADTAKIIKGKIIVILN